MDRRKLLCLGGLALAAAVGCTRRETVKSDSYTPASVQKAQDPASHRKKAAEPVADKADLKPETFVKFGNMQSDAAVDEKLSNDQRQRNLQLATENYKHALNLDPKCTSAIVGLSRLHSVMGDHDQALTLLDAALQKTPEIAALWFERGMVMGRKKQFEEAMTALRRAQQIEPASPQYIKAVGLMYARMGYADEGVNWLRKTMKEADARYNVAQMMQHIGQEVESKRQLQLSLKVDPQHPQTLAAMGMGPAVQPEPAVDPLQQVVYQQPGTLPPALTITVDPPTGPAIMPTRPAAPAAAAPAKRSSVQIGFEPN